MRVNPGGPRAIIYKNFQTASIFMVLFNFKHCDFTSYHINDDFYALIGA